MKKNGTNKSSQPQLWSKYMLSRIESKHVQQNNFHLNNAKSLQDEFMPRKEAPKPREITTIGYDMLSILPIPEHLKPLLGLLPYYGERNGMFIEGIFVSDATIGKKLKRHRSTIIRQRHALQDLGTISYYFDKEDRRQKIRIHIEVLLELITSLNSVKLSNRHMLNTEDIEQSDQLDAVAPCTKKVAPCTKKVAPCTKKVAPCDTNISELHPRSFLNYTSTGTGLKNEEKKSKSKSPIKNEDQLNQECTKLSNLSEKRLTPNNIRKNLHTFKIPVEQMITIIHILNRLGVSKRHYFAASNKATYLLRNERRGMESIFKEIRELYAPSMIGCYFNTELQQVVFYSEEKKSITNMMQSAEPSVNNLYREEPSGEEFSEKTKFNHVDDSHTNMRPYDFKSGSDALRLIVSGLQQGKYGIDMLKDHSSSSTEMEF